MAVLPVGPGETYASMAAALAVAGPADEIEVRADLNESLLVNKAVAAIRTDGTPRTINGTINYIFGTPISRNPVFTFDTLGATPFGQDVLVEGFILKLGVGQSEAEYLARFDRGLNSMDSRIIMRDCHFQPDSQAGHCLYFTPFGQNILGSFRLERCKFSGGALGKGVNQPPILNSGDASGAIVFENCEITVDIGIQSQGAGGTPSDAIQVNNCSFKTRNRCFGETSAPCITAKNNLIWGTTFGDTLNMDPTQQKNNALNGANPGGWDSSNLFNRAGFAADLVDPATPDFNLVIGSALRDAALDIGLLVDIDLVPRPQGAAPDIGAHELLIPAPDQVADVVVTATTSNSVALQWSAAANAEEYEIWRALVTGQTVGNFKKINTATVTGTSYTDNATNSNTAPKTGAHYAYKVRGVNSG